MEKKIIVVIIIFLLFLFIPIPRHLKDGGTKEYKALTYKISKVNKLVSDTKYEKGIIIEILGIELYNNVKIEESQKNESEQNKVEESITNIKILINNNEYIASLEDNETVQAFAGLLPKNFEMKELNGNEKYFYMDDSLPTNSYNPQKIEVGDIMLYNDNCLVIFYKLFETSYSYTKIGHIDNLPNLDNKNIIVSFLK